MKKNIVIAFVLLLQLLTACSKEKPISDVSQEFDTLDPNKHYANYESETPETGNVTFENLNTEEQHETKEVITTTTVGQQSQTTIPAKPTTTLSREVVVEFIPGESIPQIAKKLEKADACKAVDFLKCVNEYDFSKYEYIAKIPNSPEKCYKLEGYIAADKYRFYRNGKPEAIIEKTIEETEKRLRSLSVSPNEAHKVLTLASIIEKEVAIKDHRHEVAAIFQNRLDIVMKLKADPTINYLEWYVKQYMDISRFAPTYNTYKTKALPPGPICSPGNSAIRAVKNPSTKMEGYYYFAANENGFRADKTGEEHADSLHILGIKTTTSKAITTTTKNATTTNE